MPLDAADAEALAPTLAAVERMLSTAFRDPVHIATAERITAGSRRNVVLRCHLSSPAAPASVIVKKLATSGGGPSSATAVEMRRFARDWAGARFLSELGVDPPLGPRVHGGDPELGLVVLEDLGPHQSLVGPLLEGDAARAETALAGFAAHLGAMHASTVGKAPLFARVLGAISADALPPPGRFGAELKETARAIEDRLVELDVAAEAGLARELDGLADALGQPGPFSAYVHGDPCPDNVFFTNAGVRLVDFEFGGFGHALLDGAYGRMMFPTCWCANRIPAPVVTRMETAYRAALAAGCTEAGDDRVFSTALVDACAYWLLTSLSWHLPGALTDDREWGLSTLRPRLLTRLEAFVTVAEGTGHLPALRGTASRLLESVRRRWPDSEPLPFYPAFRAL